MICFFSYTKQRLMIEDDSRIPVQRKNKLA